MPYECNLIETKRNSTLLYEGKILRLYRDEVTLADGSTTFREVIRHRGASCVLALTDDLRVILVRQFRYPHQQILTEVPAGKLEDHEAPIDCARRELLEETGYTATHLIPLAPLICTPAYDDEIIHIFLATDLTAGTQKLDDGEFLSVVTMPLQEAVDRVIAGDLRDAKTQSAILQASYLLSKGSISF